MSAYLTRLLCAAILCALVDALCGKKGGVRKLTAGIFLTMVAFSLPMDLELPELKQERFLSEARAAVAEGEDLARDARADIIIVALEAYVWNKAEAMGLQVEVRITLDADLRPSRAELSGAASPLERQRLTDALVRELGVKEGDVVWTQSHQSST